MNSPCFLYWKKAWDYGSNRSQVNNYDIPKDFHQKYLKEMLNIRDELRTKLPTKIEEIEDKFRELVSVKE